MAALELLTFQATAPGANASMAAVAGNSATIRDTRKGVYLLRLWQQRQSAGITRVTSPLLHDAVVGLGGSGPIGHAMLQSGWYQPLRAQDVLTVQGSGSAVAGDIETSCALVYYEDLPGSQQHLITYDELVRRGEAVYTFANTLALGAAGGYSGSELVTAEEDQWKANREYAWLGTSGQIGAAAVRMTGTDFGNLGVGLPLTARDNVSANGWFTSHYWADLAKELGAAMVPVMNSSNRSNTFLDGVTDENGTDAIVKTTMVLLSPPATGRKVKK